MSLHRTATSLLLGISLTGCGTFVPGLQEFPGDAADGQLLVQAIVQNVTCEVQNAINDVIRKDIEDVRSKLFRTRRTAWLDTWGVQLTLGLTVNEKSSVNPTVSWLPPSPASSIFNLNAGATLSADATRVDKLSSYYSVQELLARGYCHPDSRPGGLFLMQSDLKLKEWLLDNVMLQGTGEIAFPSRKDGPFKQNVISHGVKFEVVSSGNVTPGWKLTRVSVNQSGSFLAASRTRTHDLLITMGPADQPVVIVARGTPAVMVATRGKSAPGVAATNSHLASEIGIAVSNALKGVTVP